MHQPRTHAPGLRLSGWSIERMADYYMRMPVEEISLFAFSALPKLERIGYDYARGKITEWRAQHRWIAE